MKDKIMNNTSTFKELTDGLREAGEGRTEGRWMSEPEYQGSRAYEVFASNPLTHFLAKFDGDLPFGGSNEANARFIAYFGTHANAIIEALEQAADEYGRGYKNGLETCQHVEAQNRRLQRLLDDEKLKVAKGNLKMAKRIKELEAENKQLENRAALKGGDA